MHCKLLPVFTKVNPDIDCTVVAVDKDCDYVPPPTFSNIQSDHLIYEVRAANVYCRWTWNSLQHTVFKRRVQSHLFMAALCNRGHYIFAM